MSRISSDRKQSQVRFYMPSVTDLDNCYGRVHIQGDSVHSVHSVLHVLWEGGSGQLLYQTRTQYYSLQVDLHWYHHLHYHYISRDHDHSNILSTFVFEFLFIIINIMIITCAMMMINTMQSIRQSCKLGVHV